MINDNALASLIETTRLAFEESLRETLASEPFDPRNVRIARYFQAILGAEPLETLHVTFLDSRCGYIDDRIFFRGSTHELKASMVPVLRKALQVQAGAIVLAHNHPSGEAGPSEADFGFTRSAAAACQAVGIALMDHLIVAGSAIYSMAGERRLA